MSPIKDFRMAYEALNKEGTFSAGDTVTGTVSLTLTKDTKVKSLFVKAKGDVNVRWTEGIGEDQETYIAHKRYFKVKECLVTENAKGTVLSEGVHQFSFRLQIPEGNMPSSFKGLHGRIVYMLEAKLSRSWRRPDRLQTEIIFASKTLPQPAEVMCPQYGSVYKEMGVFSKGQVQMSATISRKVCSPGDTLSVFAKLDNSSSKKMRPKYSLHQKIVYLANGSANVCDNSLWKMYGDFITPNSKETVTCQLKTPVNAIYSLQNCDLISINYYLKVYLDISFASDPEVVFPLVIIPPGSANLHTGMGPGPYPAASHLQQVGSVNKEMGLFSKGRAHMDVTVDRRAYAPGETAVIVAKINNSSSNEMTPKVSLIQDVLYRANTSTKHETNIIHKVVDKCIKPQTQKEVRCAVRIPPGQMQTVQNCEIISVEYHLKVYLGISFSFDPEVKFPVVILPPDLAPGPQPCMAPSPYQAGASGGPSYSDFPPPAFPGGPYVPTGSGAYGYPAPDPTQPVNTPSGYNNQWPQQATSYDFSTASFSASAVQHQAPSAPPQF